MINIPYRDLWCIYLQICRDVYPQEVTTSWRLSLPTHQRIHCLEPRTCNKLGDWEIGSFKNIKEITSGETWNFIRHWKILEALEDTGSMMKYVYYINHPYPFLPSGVRFCHACPWLALQTTGVWFFASRLLHVSLVGSPWLLSFLESWPKTAIVNKRKNIC